MSGPMKTVLIYFAAALAEIAGCFAFWAWFRLDKSVFLVGTGHAVPCRFRLATGAQPRRSGGPRLCSLRWRLHRIVPAVAMGRRRASPGSMGCSWSGHLPCRCGYYSLGTAQYLRGSRRRGEALNRSIRSPFGSRVPTTRRCFPSASRLRSSRFSTALESSDTSFTQHRSKWAQTGHSPHPARTAAVSLDQMSVLRR